jgi:hypothetical protein
MKKLGLAALTVGLALAPGCDSGDPETDIHSFMDAHGHSCTIDAHDISDVATCEVNASTLTTCSGGTEAVFVTNPDVNFTTHVWTLQNCLGCIDRPNHHTAIVMGSCANITCAADSYHCTSGACQLTSD